MPDERFPQLCAFAKPLNDNTFAAISEGNCWDIMERSIVANHFPRMMRSRRYFLTFFSCPAGLLTSRRSGFVVKRPQSSSRNPKAATNYGNICDASYKTTLNRISDNIALQLDNSFALTNLPDSGSLSLAIETAPGSLVPIDPTSYLVKDKTVSFLANPSEHRPDLPGKTPLSNVLTYQLRLRFSINRCSSTIIIFTDFVFLIRITIIQRDLIKESSASFLIVQMVARWKRLISRI